MKMNGDPVAVVIMGPTASGKSRLAIELSAHFPAEIISVDSAQIYREMDIGTAKPGPEERKAVPHHLLDIVDPTDAYSAARFRQDALRLIAEIRARGRMPLLVGGTMMYFRTFREGLSDLPAADAQIRAQIETEAASCGWPGMHEELARVDPITAARIKRNDIQRIQRALEIFRITGSPMSTLIAQSQREASSPPTIDLALTPTDRATLHRKIASRLDCMLKAGLVDELRALRQRYALRPEMPSMRCVGYRQAWQFLAGEIDFPDMRDQAVYATRQLAKRQLTWMRGTEGLALLDPEDPALFTKARSIVERHLGRGFVPH